MRMKQFKSSPFNAKISFHKVLEKLEDMAKTESDYRGDYAKALLKEANEYPELREGITDPKDLTKYKKVISNLLTELFPIALSDNEIKAATIPFHNITFNYTERFKKILDEAGHNFDMSIRNFSDHQFYIMSCCLILNKYYGYHFDFSRPFFYDIPDAEGITRHYRIMYNGDFIDIEPGENAVEITEDDVKLLMDNYHDLDLWKEKFPEGSWDLRGFGLMSLFDSTTESAISNLKSNLLKSEDFDEITRTNLETIFRSIYKISDLRIGFTETSLEDNLFRMAPFEDITSYILMDENELNCNSVFCDESLNKITRDRKYFIVSDIERYAEENKKDRRFADHLLEQDIKSCILAPVIKNGKLLGVIELVCNRTEELNSINANKLGYILPFLTDSIDRYYSELQNQVDAIIQKEYTAIHHSVYWKFREEALRHINAKNGDAFAYREIVFKDVYPLYGQIDVKGSSNARNESTEQDLIKQLDRILDLFRFITKKQPLPVIEQHIFELEHQQRELKKEFKADSESTIQTYIQKEAHPILEHFETRNAEIRQRIKDYFDTLDDKLEMVYDSRKDFDDTLQVINKHLAEILDKKQHQAQRFYPHFYERFKTDGVEHNMYIGASIAPKHQYNEMYLQNLRLWQLQAMIDMENEYYKLRPALPYDLDVTSLILVFSSPISVRFRMDEKLFDVDGTYNARYEVVKKRIDKSLIKGTDERITQNGKITIVYSQKQEEAEYRRYISFLQHKNLLGEEVEQFEIEDLQGVTGLKALRVCVVYDKEAEPAPTYSYDELLKELEPK